jgi:hypothetical protein
MGRGAILLGAMTLDGYHVELTAALVKSRWKIHHDQTYADGFIDAEEVLVNLHLEIPLLRPFFCFN